ncbi:MAG: hypothetical protein U0234_20300 [Sandaracinus sp.]
MGDRARIRASEGSRGGTHVGRIGALALATVALATVALATVGLATIGPVAVGTAQPRRRRAPPPSTRAEEASSAAAPVPPGPPPTRALAIAVAGNHSCAISGEHRAFCWGIDDILTLLAPRASILGERDTPTELVRSAGATRIAMQGSQPLVWVGEGSLVSYGTWDVQPLGRITHSPEAWQGDALVLEGLAAAVTVVPSADGSVLCTIDAGAMRCRGANQYGQLGSGSTEEGSEALVAVAGLHGVRTASSGGSTTCAIDDQGLACWGRATDGVLGTGATELARTPARVALPGAVEVAVSRRGHACARDASGSVWCWGRGNEGQVGNTPSSRDRPERVAGVEHASAIAVGQYFTCALVEGGRVRCWGAGNEGQLGDGRSVGSVAPVEVRGLAGVSSIALGDAHACALDASGAVWCWGRDREGSCGTATHGTRATPVRVIGP